jgi:hypothetical protein
MKQILIAWVVAATLLTGCAPRHPKDLRDIDSLRVEIEGLVHEQSLMEYNGWVYGRPSNQDSLYRAHQGLFSRENLDLVTRAWKEEPDSVQRQRLAYLRRHLTLGILAKGAAPLTDRASTYEGQASVSFDGSSIPYRQLASMLANERDPNRRLKLYSAADVVFDSLSSLARQTNTSYYRLASDLGYPSYSRMVEELKGFSLGEASLLAETALAATDSMYFLLLPNILSHYTDLDTSRFFRYDTGVLFRNRLFDPYFPKANLISSVYETYRSLGLDLSAQKNLLIDTTERPEKSPRAACFAIDVPDDIRLSIKPNGGFDDYAALFHEVGHAEQYANTTEHAMEFKYLGVSTLTETYAFLSEYLCCNPSWLRLRSSMPVPALKDYVQFQAFYRLYYVRRYCAKVLYEQQLHGGAARAEKIYAELLSHALGYKQVLSDEKRFLVDVDPHYYSVEYLRAWFLEAQLNRWLSMTYGSNWFESPSAGAFLRSLWAKGDRLTADDLLAAIGEKNISAGAWITTINDMLRFSSR